MQEKNCTNCVKRFTCKKIPKIAVEIDGGTWLPHGGRHSRTADYEKRNAATRQGWSVYYFDAELIKSGKALALMMEVLRDTIKR